MTRKFRAATALDLTHAHDNRGPRTFMARQRVAAWLDSGRKSTPKVKSDIALLETVAAS